MARESAVASPLVQWFLWLAIAGISLLILIYGRPFLLPVVVAFLVFTVLSAGINRVSRLRLGGFALPHWLAASVGLALLLVILLVLYSVVSGELLLIVAEWPRIVERLQAFAARVSDWLGEDIEEALRAAYASFNVVSAFRSVVTPAGAALTSIIVVVLYVAFMFVESAAFPTKVAKLFADDPQRAGEVSEVARQITRIHSATVGLTSPALLSTPIRVSSAVCSARSSRSRSASRERCPVKVGVASRTPARARIWGSLRG